MDFYLLKNNSAGTLDYAVLSSGDSHAIDETVSVSPGDELFMAIGCLSNSTADKTELAATFEVVPEPATFLLLTVGSLAVICRKR